MPPGPAAAAPPPDWLMMPDHGARHEDCPYPSPFAALCYACLFVVLDVLLALSVRKLVKPDKPFIPSWITHTKGNRSTAKPRNARRSHRSRTRTPGRPAKPRKHNPNAYLEYWPSTFPPCGQLCEPRGPSLYDSVAGKLTVTRGRFYPQVFVPVNCTALFAYRPQRLHVNLSHLLALYESTAAFDPMLWTDPFVRRVIDRQTAVERHSGDLLHRALTAGSLRDKRVLVYGSTHPELEARVLTLGAASVDSVLPIAGVRRPHPRLQLLSGAVWRETSLRSTKQYDAAVVGPKLWRSGLGMAGPGWYPWGDVTAVAQVWCVMKPEGRLVIEMPLNKAALWPTLTANWQQDELFRPANTSDTKRPRRFGVLHRAGQPMLTQWVLLQMPHLRVARIGNIIWAIASLIGIARTRGFQPRAISSDFSKLQAIFPALDLKLVHPSTRVEPVAEERKGMMYEPWLVDVPPNSAISGYLQSHRYFENHTAEIRRMFRFNNEVQAQAKGFIRYARQQPNQSTSGMTVAVHVRRGDVQHVHHKLRVSSSYWRRGVARLQRKFPTRSMTFILLAGGSEKRAEDHVDYEFARDNIPVPFVPTPINHTPHVDMAIMAYSDAVVISPGSFSFWGAYLNHRTCIAPNCALSRDNKYFRATDYYPPWCERLHC